MNAADLLIVHTGDADIKYMLAQHSMTMIKPEPPNDVSICQLKDADFVWLVFGFFHPGDTGYMAFGLPNTLSDAEITACWKTLITQFEREDGSNAFEHSKITFQSLTEN